MDNIRFFSNMTKSVPDSHEARLETLLEWCRITKACLDGKQIEDAKIFLEQAISEAEKPLKGQYRV